MQIPCFLYKNHSESYNIMHNILQQQQLIEIFKTVGADELHNIQIEWENQGIVEQAIQTKQEIFILTQIKSVRKQSQVRGN